MPARKPAATARDFNPFSKAIVAASVVSNAPRLSTVYRGDYKGAQSAKKEDYESVETQDNEPDFALVPQLAKQTPAVDNYTIAKVNALRAKDEKADEISRRAYVASVEVDEDEDIVEDEDNSEIEREVEEELARLKRKSKAVNFYFDDEAEESAEEEKPRKRLKKAEKKTTKVAKEDDYKRRIVERPNSRHHWRMRYDDAED